MYVLSFASFFRFDDVSRIRRSDISFKEGFMIIKVLKSKNDQLRKGVEVVILQSSSSVCPVELLKRYLVMFKIPPDSKDFISSPFLKGRALASLLPLISPLVTLLLEGAFRWDLQSLWVEPSKLGWHSLRSTMIANNGVNDIVFQRHGCWKSVQAKDTYVDDNFEQRLEVLRFLGL